jgi:hypothetical protein
MRPSGVVSKNDIGARNIEVSKSLCIMRDELTQAMASAKAIPNTPIAALQKKINTLQQ